MPNTTSTRRQLLQASGTGALGLSLMGSAQADAVNTALADFSKLRMFNLYTDKQGLPAMRQVDFDRQQLEKTNYLIRHPAARVTIGSMEPNLMMDWHVANQPNIIIPLFGTLVVILRDGERFELRYGDMLFAEDCEGSGHKSGAGPDGQFGISVQIDKSYCPAAGDSYIDTLLGKA